VRLKFFLKEGEMVLFYISVILIFILPFVFADTLTELDIPNAPPYLVMDIPNQSWLQNESNLNAFDLDDYFTDPEGGNLTFYNSSVQDIFVYIDPLTHVVSFFPREEFSGTRNVTFYASDSVYDGPSNVVMLYVGLDYYPPQWFYPSISKSAIYQYDIISFYTNWTDDRSLDRYIFSINQGAGWENFSSTNFSGVENVSSRNFQIMAPALSTIYWRFYAFDSSDNINVTDVQSFSVSGQQVPVEGGGGGVDDSEEDSTPPSTIERILGGIELQRRKSESFQLSASDFKISLKQGTSKTRVLRITNTGLDELSLSISSDKISSFVVFSETNFSIMPGKSKEVTIDFNAPERTIPGQYFGHITVNSAKTNKSLPVVLDIQAIDLEFDLILNLSEGYELVKPGKNVKVNITINNVKDLKEINASLYYAIKDFEGKVYNFSEEDVTFFYNLLLERELQVPDIAPEGRYLLYARLSDQDNIAIDSVSFEVGTKFNFSSFFKISSISFLILLLAILFSIFMVKYKRDKKKERLLELYIMLNKLKNLIKQKKEEEALELFIKIKKIYREPVAKEVFDDKERLKKEIADLYNSFSKESKEVLQSKGVGEDTQKQQFSEETNSASKGNKKELKTVSDKEGEKDDKK
jgi:hypothetical protein